MNKTQQLVWDRIQSAYRVYCLKSVREEGHKRMMALNNLLDALDYATEPAFTVETIEITDVYHVGEGC